jgi:NodT family efflux transporter outer membrane factor (OMF) lipoprotein
MPSLAVRSCAALAALTVAGCALSKPPEQAAVVKAALPDSTVIPATWRAPADTGSVSGGWLASFNDPGLTAVVTEAIANNLDLRAAAGRVDVARQSVGIVSAKLKPQVGLDVGGSVVKDADQPDAFTAGQGVIGVSWELDIWGKVRAQKAASVAGYNAAALQYAWARQSLAALTAKAWYLAVETRQLLSLSERSVLNYSQLLELVQLRRAAGKVSDLDVAEASAKLHTAQSQLRAAQADYADARRVLEVLLGRYPSAELAVADSFVPVPPPVAAGIPSLLLSRRPDVASQEQAVLAAFRSQESARLALLPSFGLTLSGGKLSDALLSLLSLNPWMVGGAVGMLVPIYQGGALRAQVRVATAQQEVQVARYGAVLLRAFAEVERALTNELLLAERLVAERAALVNRTDAVRIAMLKYRAGGIDLLSVIELQTSQLATEATVIQLENARLATRIDLYLALGGDFTHAPS